MSKSKLSRHEPFVTGLPTYSRSHYDMGKRHALTVVMVDGILLLAFVGFCAIVAGAAHLIISVV